MVLARRQAVGMNLEAYVFEMVSCGHRDVPAT
jgi:hypothetical protein